VDALRRSLITLMVSFSRPIALSMSAFCAAVGLCPGIAMSLSFFFNPGRWGMWKLIACAGTHEATRASRATPAKCLRKLIIKAPRQTLVFRHFVLSILSAVYL
jgi:hypothetical protein